MRLCIYFISNLLFPIHNPSVHQTKAADNLPELLTDIIFHDLIVSELDIVYCCTGTLLPSSKLLCFCVVNLLRIPLLSMSNLSFYGSKPGVHLLEYMYFREC